jgi:hypothetical protein
MDTLTIGISFGLTEYHFYEAVVGMLESVLGRRGTE